MSNSTPAVVSNPVWDVWRHLADPTGNYVMFKRPQGGFHGHRRNRYYRLDRDTGTLWRCYAKKPRANIQFVHSGNITRWIRMYGLQPVIPKHLQMDRGL